MLQPVIHYFLHLLFPALVARFINGKRWLNIYGIFLATMAVDADHLLAVPIFDACRCSIGFHPLHSYYAIAAYLLLLVPRKTRLIAIGLLMHMTTDGIDCLFTFQRCP